LKLRQPQLRDVVLLLLSSKTLEEIQGTEGKIILRRELVLRINQVLQKGKIRNLYFTEFVIQ
jgi:flagellar FliL protein